MAFQDLSFEALSLTIAGKMLDAWPIQVTYSKDEKGLIVVKSKNVCQHKAGLEPTWLNFLDSRN